jgi:choline transport protein
MITACIVLLYISYSIPISFHLYRRLHGTSVPPGPFDLGMLGVFSNVVLLLWTLFTLVMYSFPYTQPVLPGNMNYVSAVYAVVVIIMGMDWMVRGRKSFRGVGERKTDVRGGSIVGAG